MSEEKMETMNDFKEELEASFRELHVGDIVDGTVIGITDDGVTVDLKYYTQGFIKNADMSNDPTFKVSEDVHEGDAIKATIVKMDNGDGSIALSRKAAIDVLAWEKLAEMMENKEVFTVQILETVKAGVVTYVEGIRAFIPASQLSDSYVENTAEWIDKDVDVRIITCDPEKKRLVLSGKEVARDRRREEVRGSKRRSAAQRPQQRPRDGDRPVQPHAGRLRQRNGEGRGMPGQDRRAAEEDRRAADAHPDPRDLDVPLGRDVVHGRLARHGHVRRLCHDLGHPQRAQQGRCRPRRLGKGRAHRA